MVTRFTRALAFTVLFVFPAIHTMEQESESHTHYKVTLTGSYRDDYDRLHDDFCKVRKESPKKTLAEFLENYRWDQLDREKEVLEYFRQIQHLVQDNDGKEFVIEDDKMNAIILDLSFKSSVPESAFPGELFDTPTRHSDRRRPLVEPVQEEETERQRSRSSSGSSSIPHPTDLAGLKPWHGMIP